MDTSKYSWRLSLAIFIIVALFCIDSVLSRGTSGCGTLASGISPQYSVQVFTCGSDATLDLVDVWDGAQLDCNQTTVEGVVSNETDGKVIYANDQLNIRVLQEQEASMESSTGLFGVGDDEFIFDIIADGGEQLVYEDADMRISAATICELLPRDCGEVLGAGFNESGTYQIYPAGSQEPIEVYCDLETDGGGWTVIQRRDDNRVDFYRTWADYKAGFGEVSGNHWLGNEKIHRLTSGSRNYTLRIDLVKFNDRGAVYVEYDHFEVAGEEETYKLSIGNFNGMAEYDALRSNNNMGFLTLDMESSHMIFHCPNVTHGGWWYESCGQSNLNGKYYDNGDHTPDPNGVFWRLFENNSLKECRMMIR